jgi:predicted HAD superfamily Cof-like phosphohydrolase
MHQWTNAVKEFHQAIGHPTHVIPFPKDGCYGLFRLRIKCLLEEVMEYAEACGIALRVSGRLVQLDDFEYDEIHVDGGDIVSRMDALCDIIYFALGGAVVEGVNLDPLFEEVHRSNMTKVHLDGTPIYNRDGKLVKPPHFKPPQLKQIIDGQS